MRLKRYLLLEKVSKKEVDIALNNSNILIGCEFEFIHDDIPDDTDSIYNEGYREALDAWNYYRNQAQEYEREHDKYYDEIEKEYYWIEREEDELSDLNDLLNELNPDHPRWKERDRLKKELDTRRVELNDAIDKNEEKEDSDLEYLDQFWPEIPDEYLEYMENTIGVPDELIYNKRAGTYISKYGPDDFDIPEPPSPEDIGFNGVSGDDAWLEAVGEIDFSDAPFSNFEIGDYGTVYLRPGDTKWAIEPDTSLGYQGIEIKSPPTPLPQALKDIKEMFNYIKKHGATTKATGFHVHMSVKGITDLEGKLDPIKLLMFMDEGLVWKHFASRMSNTYAKSMKDKFKSETSLENEDFKELAIKKKLKAKMAAEHFDAINLSNWKQGHVEFRYMGGRDYHRKFKEVEQIIGNYSYNLSLALDPEFKRKEYLKKIQRIANKVELYKQVESLEWFENVLISANKLDKSFKNYKLMLKKRVREIKKYISILKKSYEISDRDYILLGNNAIFVNEMEEDIKKDIGKIVDKWIDILPEDHLNDIMPYIGMKLINRKK